MLSILRALSIAPLQHAVYKYFITQLQNKKWASVVMAMAFCILSYLNRIVKNHVRTLTLS